MLTPNELNEVRRAVGESIGLGSWLFPFDGSASATAALSDSERVALYRALLEWDTANPGQLSDVQRNALRNLANWTPAASYSLGDMASDFFEEAANQAQEINPLSSVNRGTFAAVLVVVAVVGVAAWAFAKGGGKLPNPAK